MKIFYVKMAQLIEVVEIGEAGSRIDDKGNIIPMSRVYKTTAEPHSTFCVDTAALIPYENIAIQNMEIKK